MRRIMLRVRRYECFLVAIQENGDGDDVEGTIMSNAKLDVCVATVVARRIERENVELTDRKSTRICT